MDLLLDIGQMRMKSWKPNNELLEKNDICTILSVFSDQFLPPPQAFAQFHGFDHACMSPVAPPEGRFKCYVLPR